jgi:hypothetical protein
VPKPILRHHKHVQRHNQSPHWSQTRSRRDGKNLSARMPRHAKWCDITVLHSPSSPARTRPQQAEWHHPVLVAYASLLYIINMHATLLAQYKPDTSFCSRTCMMRNGPFKLKSLRGYITETTNVSTMTITKGSVGSCSRRTFSPPQVKQRAR